MGQLLLKLTLNRPTEAEPDQIAFRRCYDDYANLVRSLLFRLCGEHDLDDLVQEVFVKVWGGLKKFDGRSSLKTWIYKVTYNHSMDYLRRQKPQPVRFEDYMGGKAEASDFSAIQKALAALSPDHRGTVVLHCMEGLSLEEVAELTKVPLGTVKSRLHFARKQLHTFLQKQGVNYG